MGLCWPPPGSLTGLRPPRPDLPGPGARPFGLASLRILERERLSTTAPHLKLTDENVVLENEQKW